MTEEEILDSKKISLNNKDKLNFPKVGCYYCQKIFPPSEIKEWIDKGTTAICPYCSVDSIIGTTNLSKNLLKNLHNKWFNKTISPQCRDIIKMIKENENLSKIKEKYPNVILKIKNEYVHITCDSSQISVYLKSSMPES